MADLSSLSISSDLSTIKRQMEHLDDKVNSIDKNMGRVSSQVTDIKKELDQLRNDFLMMMDQQRKDTAVSKASTELIALNQEMESKFGNYGVVRKTMVGVLQATDVALVRKTTISQVSEELMISTPDYWLAPVLVAIAAWINNNRDLAERAIKEAVKRDEEHTSLAMALICRRNGRRDTCYEWLSRYFATQNAARIDADSMVYIDAYINGVFGPDDKHLCDDYLSRWIEQVKQSSVNFDEEQTQSWADYFKDFSIQQKVHYPALSNMIAESAAIESYATRLDRIAGIQKKFDGLRVIDVDSEGLASEIDHQLMNLVQSDDKTERALRSRQEELEAIKYYDGDEQKAREMVRQHRQEKIKRTMNIIDQMTRAVREPNRQTESYKKKSAMRFLRPYINSGFNRFMDQSATALPQEITVTVGDWSHKATGTEQLHVLQENYHQHLGDLFQKEREDLEANLDSKQHTKIMTGIVLLVISIILMFFFPPLGAVLLIFGLIQLFIGISAKGSLEKETQKIVDKYDKQYQDGAETIELVLDEWESAKSDIASKEDLLKIDKVA